MFKQLSLFNKAPTRPLLQTPYPVEILRRPYQRSLRLSIRPNGNIRITAARSTPAREIEAFLNSHRAWIEKSLTAFMELRKDYPQKHYIEGEKFLFLGLQRTFQIQPAQQKRMDIELQAQALICHVPERILKLSSPTAQRETLREAVRGFYEKVGRSLLTKRVEHYSQRMELYPAALSFRSQKTRWGSCSTQKKISLNWRLIVAPPAVIDYVVIHELAHLKHYDHSRAFWELVERFAPHHRNLRQWLRINQYETDFLAEVSELHPLG